MKYLVFTLHDADFICDLHLSAAILCDEFNGASSFTRDALLSPIFRDTFSDTLLLSYKIRRNIKCLSTSLVFNKSEGPLDLSGYGSAEDIESYIKKSLEIMIWEQEDLDRETESFNCDHVVVNLEDWSVVYS